MGRLDDTPEDLEKSMEEGEKAGAGGGMFIASKRLVNDLDKIYIVFLELVSYGPVTYKGDTKTRGQCNVLSYGKDGDTLEEGVFILEMAPKHTRRFMTKLAKPKYNRGMLYEIERHGIPNDTQTSYEMEHHRDLTPDEIAHVETVTMHTLFKGQDSVVDDSDTTPVAAAPPVVTDAVREFNALVKVEMARLGWDKETVKAAIARCMLIPKTGAEMSPDERSFFVAQMQGLKPGQGVKDIEAYTVDMDEDTDFF